MMRRTKILSENEYSALLVLSDFTESTLYMGSDSADFAFEYSLLAEGNMTLDMTQAEEMGLFFFTQSHHLIMYLLRSAKVYYYYKMLIEGLEVSEFDMEDTDLLCALNFKYITKYGLSFCLPMELLTSLYDCSEERAKAILVPLTVGKLIKKFDIVVDESETEERYCFTQKMLDILKNHT